ncbi:Fe-S cluster assembly ATPase SufC [Candidatus Peregrinibacteria bacterium]|nr:Fe-S cluster assembly ATPase SufC [Candidatus Peregrinibacteria bacterium]
MFSIKNLKVSINEKPILQGLSLKIKPGEIHAIMGPNGSGKSTLANTIMGHPKYTISHGEILMDGENLVSLKADKRARAGVFLAFQYPKEIPGVTVLSFLQMAVAAVRKVRGEPQLNPIEFRKLLRSLLAEFSLDAKFMNRYINEGFSGGEKKKMEILQMALLEPKIAVLDETDSGLDVDALKIVAEGINRLASPKRGILLITHYQRILHYIKPHFVHVMIEGQIVKSGGPELAQQLEQEGYDWLRPLVTPL